MPHAFSKVLHATDSRLCCEVTIFNLKMENIRREKNYVLFKLKLIEFYLIKNTVKLIDIDL